MMKIVFLGIGTNLGNREKNLEQAVASIGQSIGRVLITSSIYQTEPWGFQSEKDFLNMIVKIETELAPDVLLEKILAIESVMGRVRGPEHFSSRLIDIDILLYDDIINDTENLKIPHPLLQERRFVLVPLCEIAAELMHPVLKKTFKELLEECEDKGVVKKHR
jgi:2-amino-4-hydroxy-6-hydroxymethyldihydropteridine diphosphokinase